MTSESAAKKLREDSKRNERVDTEGLENFFLDDHRALLSRGLSLKEAVYYYGETRKEIKAKILDGSIPAIRLPESEGSKWKVFPDGVPELLSHLTPKKHVETEQLLEADNAKSNPLPGESAPTAEKTKSRKKKNNTGNVEPASEVSELTNKSLSTANASSSVSSDSVAASPSAQENETAQKPKLRKKRKQEEDQIDPELAAAVAELRETKPSFAQQVSEVLANISFNREDLFKAEVVEGNILELIPDFKKGTVLKTEAAIIPAISDYKPVPLLPEIEYAVPVLEIEEFAPPVFPQLQVEYSGDTVVPTDHWLVSELMAPPLDPELSAELVSTTQFQISDAPSEQELYSSSMQTEMNFLEPAVNSSYDLDFQSSTMVYTESAGEIISSNSNGGELFASSKPGTVQNDMFVTELPVKEANTLTETEQTEDVQPVEQSAWSLFEQLPAPTYTGNEIEVRTEIISQPLNEAADTIAEKELQSIEQANLVEITVPSASVEQDFAPMDLPQIWVSEDTALPAVPQFRAVTRSASSKLNAQAQVLLEEKALSASSDKKPSSKAVIDLQERADFLEKELKESIYRNNYLEARLTGLEDQLKYFTQSHYQGKALNGYTLMLPAIAILFALILTRLLG